MSNINFIYDRTTLIDDFVYSFLNKKQSDISTYYNVVKALLAHCKVIHLMIDDDIQRQRLEKRGDEYITPDMLSKIRERYIKFYNNLDNRVYFVELSENIEDNIRKIMEVIND